MTTGEIVALAAALTSLISVGVTWRKMRSDNRLTNGNAIQSYQKSLDNSAKHEGELMDEVRKLREELADVRAELDEVKAESAKWHDWAQRLVYQLKSHGIVPVELDPTQPLKREKE